MQKKIGTLSDIVKLTDEEIDALPKVFKYIKHTILDSEKNEETKRVSDALQKIIDLDKLEFDPLIEDPTAYGMALCLALATTSISKTTENNEAKEVEEEKKRLQEKADSLTKELIAKDEELKKLKAEQDRYSYIWRSVRPDDDGDEDWYDSSKAYSSVKDAKGSKKTAKVDSDKIDVNKIIGDLFNSKPYFDYHRY